MICKTCELRTERLLAKEWHSMCDEVLGATELEQVVQSLLTPEVTAYLPEHWRNRGPSGSAQSWIAERDQEGAILLVVTASTHTPVGFLTLFESDDTAVGHQEIRLGYVLAESAWGQGLATELLAAFVDWSRQAGIRRLIAGVLPDNIASVRVLEKCGFTSTEPETSANSDVRFFELLTPSIGTSAR